MTLVNIISAIGNNNSIYPLIVRDCGVEAPTKITMTYSQNLKDSKEMAKNALRERTIDEYGTSLVWLGGIPLINKICDLGIKKLGYNPKISPSLFKETDIQGAKFNTSKFKNLASKEVKEIENALNNRKKFEMLLAGKFLLSTLIPIAIMGFVIPKLNFALTNKIKLKKQEKKENNSNNIAFKGLSSTLSNMTNVNKMAITDAGLTVGRVTTARNKFEKLEMGFKMAGMMFLNYVAPIWFAKFFDNISGKILKTDINLNLKILSDKELINLIKQDKLNIPKENIIEFLDKKPNEKFSKLAEKFYDIKYLPNGIRDPRVYVNEKKLSDFAKKLDNFKNSVQKSDNIENFVKKATRVKSANIIANIALSSFLLAVGLPKATFIMRKKITGSEAEPGLIQ